MGDLEELRIKNFELRIKNEKDYLEYFARGIEWNGHGTGGARE